MVSPLEHAKRPATRLGGPYGHPMHPMLVPVPIGAWVASLVFDVASHAGGPASTLYVGSYWLIAIGVTTALVAAVFGLLDLLRVPPGTAALRTGLVHMGLNVGIVGIYVLDFLLRWTWGPTDAGVQPGLIVLSGIGVVLLLASGWLGGKLSYHYGVRVADEVTQAEGYAA